MIKWQQHHLRTACGRFFALPLLAGLALASSFEASAATVTVGTAAELQSAVNSANGAGGDQTILLRDGTYTLSDTLYINAPKITISSESGDRKKVIIQGDAMSRSALVGNVIRVAAANFQLRGVTLQKSRWHLIQVAGETNADYLVIRDCVLRDAYEQMLKVTLDPNKPSITSDYGLVENCVFEYSAGVGPQYYIGGIDTHGAKNWVVRGNTFRNIISPSVSVAEFAVHFWNGSANNVVERNAIVNCDRGIGFGLDGRPNSGGVIRNNMIYHAANAGSFGDVAIALIESPDTKVYNNTVYMQNTFPWAIEYRFPTTKNVLIANNLTNKPIQLRDGSTGTQANNITGAAQAWFANAAVGDLHLGSAISNVVDKGQAIAGLTDDFDTQSRPQGAGVDIGADEYFSTAGLQSPRKQRIINP